MRAFCLSAPANLLLLGEYAVLEEGGRGIWLAPEVRGILRFEEDSALQGLELTTTFRGQAGSESVRSPLASSPMAKACMESLRSCCGWTIPGGVSGRLSLDTRALDKGMGSSAVACVLLCAGLARLAGHGEDEARFLEITVRAHRIFQGGRGSGYDCAASLFGSSGLFTGGSVPLAQGLAIPEGLEFRLHRGPAGVKTPGAIDRYGAWKARDPGAHAVWFRSSGDLCGEWVQVLQDRECEPARRTALLQAILERARDRGIALGELIGVDARLPWGIKSLGAGNELGISVQSGTRHGCSGSCQDNDEGERVIVSSCGLREESTVV